MIVTSGGQTVSCLTDNSDGTVSVRLNPRSDKGTVAADGKGREVVLVEPSLREYAELRTLIVTTHEGIQAAYPAPVYPADVTEEDAKTPEGRQRLIDYQQAVAKWTTDRNRAIKAIVDDAGNEVTPPYARCMIDVVDRLADVNLTLDDLVPEALQPRTLTGLLELWDAPLGGPGDLTNNPVLRALAEATTPAPPTAAPESVDPPAVDSPEPEPSSPLGTEHSPQSLPEPSTT